MIDARIVAAVVIFVAGVSATVDVWTGRGAQTHLTIPDDKALRCEVVNK